MPRLHVASLTGHNWARWFTDSQRCVWRINVLHLSSSTLACRDLFSQIKLATSSSSQGFSDWPQWALSPAQYYLPMKAGRLIACMARPINAASSLTMGPSRCLALCWGIEELNSTLEDQRRLQMHLVTCQGLPPHTIWPVLFPLSGRRTSAGSSDGR